jgi:cyanate permease
MGSVMGAWQLIFIISAIPCGILLDKISVRSALTLGGLIIAASALARGFADSYAMLMIAVMLFGVGGPIISTGAPKVVTQHFDGQSRGLAMGIYMTGPSIGGVVSLTLTHSMLVPFFDDSWRAVMFLWGGFAAGVSILWWLLTTINPIPKIQEDMHQGTLEAATAPLKQTQIIMNLLRQPSVVLVLLMGVGVFMFNHGLMNWLPALLEEGGLSEVDSGYWAAIPTVVGIAGSLLIPRLATPERRYHILIALTLCAALASVLLQFSADLPRITGLVMQGIARSSLMTVLILTLLELPAVGEKYAGVASGIFFTAAEVGGVLGPISLGILYDVSGGFSAGLYLLSSISLLIAISAMALKRTSTSAHNS